MTLELCKNCWQLTNHKNGKCLKCEDKNKNTDGDYISVIRRDDCRDTTNYATWKSEPSNVIINPDLYDDKRFDTK